MIKTTEVKVYQDRLYCPACETEMKFTGAVLLSNPAQYEHKCPKCEKRLNVSKSYPCIRYEDNC